jgi:hypothetical protein
VLLPVPKNSFSLGQVRVRLFGSHFIGCHCCSGRAVTLTLFFSDELLATRLFRLEKALKNCIVESKKEVPPPQKWLVKQIEDNPPRFLLHFRSRKLELPPDVRSIDMNAQQKVYEYETLTFKNIEFRSKQSLESDVYLCIRGFSSKFLVSIYNSRKEIVL